MKNQLRIIGGQWRGRKLLIADVEGLRPTGDRIRETVFNWLQGDIVDAHCLDCFAGTGALGFESLSRGAKAVIALEKNKTAFKQLQHNASQLKTHECEQQSLEIIQTDALNWLENSSLEKQSIDIVFIDPPFQANLWAKVFEALINSQCLKKEACIYIECQSDTPIVLPKQWSIYREKVTGTVRYLLTIHHD